MPKLLSQDEALDIATKMTAAYGLPPPVIMEDAWGSSWNVTVKIYRSVKKEHTSKYFKIKSIKSERVQVKDFYANDYEDALSKLEQELRKFDNRAKVAENYREKYAMEEADEAFDEILQQPFDNVTRAIIP